MAITTFCQEITTDFMMTIPTACFTDTFTSKPNWLVLQLLASISALESPEMLHY
jgi:hypothetical protein